MKNKTKGFKSSLKFTQNELEALAISTIQTAKRLGYPLKKKKIYFNSK